MPAEAVPSRRRGGPGGGSGCRAHPADYSLLGAGGGAGGHLQTLRRATTGSASPLKFRLRGKQWWWTKARTTRVLCHCHWQPAEVRADRLTIQCWCMDWRGRRISRYIRGITRYCHGGGAAMLIRMNMRNCAGEHGEPMDADALSKFGLSARRGRRGWNRTSCGCTACGAWRMTGRLFDGRKPGA